VPLAALTAWQALFVQAQLAPGQPVFIHGAARGVGTYAVQLARWAGDVLVSVVTPPPAYPPPRGDVRFVYFVVEPSGEELRQIGGLIDLGQVRPGGVAHQVGAKHIVRLPEAHQPAVPSNQKGASMPGLLSLIKESATALSTPRLICLTEKRSGLFLRSVLVCLLRMYTLETTHDLYLTER
jgi:hypothetical protein